MKWFLIATDIGLAKGGIQTWAYYISKLLRHNDLEKGSFSYSNATFRDYIKLIIGNFKNDFFILMDWQKVLSILPSMLLSTLGLKKGKYIIFIHGNEILNLNKYKKYFLHRLVHNKNTFFVSNSRQIADLFKNEFCREADLICYPFIDVEMFGMDLTKKRKQNKKIFFTVSRLVKRKNIANAVLAVNKLIRTGCNIEYIIAGDGPEKEALDILIKKLNLGNKIRLTGLISENEKKQYFAQSDLFLLPSVYDSDDGSIEGFGIVFIEANLFGVPVISGSTGGMVEAVVDGITGFHADGNVNDIADKIRKSLNHNFSKNEIINYAKKFDYKKQDGFVNFLKNI